ncbi:MAG: hypothetical protein WBW55_08390 [Desulfobaccales bacterium]
MEGKFIIPYSEYAVIEHLTDLLKKRLNLKKRDDYYYSSYIPTSRQEKGIDFLIYNSLTKKCSCFQVKSSRSYLSGTPGKKGQYEYNLWFNNFIKRYHRNKADYYILFALYPLYSLVKSINSKRYFWKNIILCIPDAEMKGLLDSVRTKKEKKPDAFFGISFDEPPEKVFGIRGWESPIDLSQYLIDKQLDAIIQSMT